MSLLALFLALCISGAGPAGAADTERPAIASPAGGRAVRYVTKDGLLIAEDAATGKRLNERAYNSGEAAGAEEYGWTWLGDSRRLLHRSGIFGAGVNIYNLEAYADDLRHEWYASATKFDVVGQLLIVGEYQRLRDTNTGSDNGIAAILPATGRMLWRRTGASLVGTSNGYVLASDGSVLRASDGKVVTKVAPPEPEEAGEAQAGGRFVALAPAAPPRPARVRSSAAGLRLAWSARLPARSHVQFLAAGPEHVAIALTVARKSERDEVWCLSLATGKVAWKKGYPCGALDLLPAGRWESPALGITHNAPRAYVSLNGSELQALDWRTGRMLWKADVPELTWRVLPGDRVAIYPDTADEQVRAGATGRVLPAESGRPSLPWYATVMEDGRYSLGESYPDDTPRARKKEYASGPNLNLQQLEVISTSSHSSIYLREDNGSAFLLRAFGRDLAQRWVHRAGAFDLVGGVLVAEAWQSQTRDGAGTWGGLVGLAPASGKVLWRRPKPAGGADFLAGQWNGQALVSRLDPETGSVVALVGLRPRDGKELWRLALPPAPAWAVLSAAACVRRLALLVPQPDGSYEARGYLAR